MAKNKHFTLNETKDIDIITYLDTQKNISGYLKDLIREDMKRKANENSNKRTEIRKEIDLYGRTNPFRALVVEALKDFSVMQVFDEYIDRKIEKHFTKYYSKTIEKSIQEYLDKKM